MSTPSKRPRLTLRELAALIEATSFRLAGEQDDLTDPEWAALQAADEKLRAMRAARRSA